MTLFELALLIVWHGSPVILGSSSAGGSLGNDQTPLSTPLATWAATMDADPFDNGATSPTPSGNAYKPFAPNLPTL